MSEKAPRTTSSVVVQVPDIEHPTLCWQQRVENNVIVNFARCVKLKGHDGLHTWERQRRRYPLEKRQIPFVIQ